MLEAIKDITNLHEYLGPERVSALIMEHATPVLKPEPLEIKHPVPAESEVEMEYPGLPEVYYDFNRGWYWQQDAKEKWIGLNETQIKRHLKAQGFSSSKPPDAAVSPLDQVLNNLQMNQNIHYAGPLAGYSSGVHAIEGQGVLVTESPHLITPVPGEWPLLSEIFENLLVDDIIDQRPYLFGWLKIAVTSLYRGQRSPGQCLALAGPADCGKSLVQNLITEILGGRSARPYQYMAGLTQFNSDLFAAEHLMIEDEQASTDIRARRNFGAVLKTITVNEGQRCHAKNRNALTLRPFWRLSVTVNDEPENLMVLPPLDESIEDKVMLLRARKQQMPMPTSTGEQRKIFWEAIASELPAFVAFLLDGFSIPTDLVDERFGVRAYHHPALLQALDALAPERRLLSIIDSGGLFYGPLADPWEGTAEELESKLLNGDASVVYEARRLLSFYTACGVYLGRLASKHPNRVSKRILHGNAQWTIQPPQGGG